MDVSYEGVDKRLILTNMKDADLHKVTTITLPSSGDKITNLYSDTDLRHMYLAEEEILAVASHFLFGNTNELAELVKQSKKWVK